MIISGAITITTKDVGITEDKRIHLYLGEVSLNMTAEEAQKIVGLLNGAIQEIDLIEKENNDALK